MGLIRVKMSRSKSPFPTMVLVSPIPSKIKCYLPFFTTKPTMQGRELGLSLAYDIIKADGGELKVETTFGQGSTFFCIITFVN